MKIEYTKDGEPYITPFDDDGSMILASSDPHVAALLKRGYDQMAMKGTGKIEFSFGDLSPNKSSTKEE